MCVLGAARAVKAARAIKVPKAPSGSLRVTKSRGLLGPKTRISRI